MNLIGVFFSVLTFFFIAKLFGKAAAPHLQEYGGDYFPFVLIGIAFSTFLGVGLGTSAECAQAGADDRNTGSHADHADPILFHCRLSLSLEFHLLFIQYSCLSS